MVDTVSNIPVRAVRSRRTQLNDVDPPIASPASGSAAASASIREVYRSMQDIVFETLRDEILTGKVAPGYLLNSLALSKRLGVSRNFWPQRWVSRGCDSHSCSLARVMPT